MNTPTLVPPASCVNYEVITPSEFLRSKSRLRSIGMSRSTKSAVPRNKSRKSDEALVAKLIRELERRHCDLCQYAVDSDGNCTNYDCEAQRKSPRSESRTRPELFHGRRWRRWVLDLERLVLVCDGLPTIRRSNLPPYIGFFGTYECDLEHMRTPARLLDFIFQVRGSIWGADGSIQDLINALHDVLCPQSSLCSNGVAKTIENPREFLEARVGASVAKRRAA